MLLIILVRKECDWSHRPGDSIGVVCPNRAEEVEELVSRLNLTSVAYRTCTVGLLSDTRKKNAIVPPYLPATATLFHILQTCCEIRDVPKKVIFFYFRFHSWAFGIVLYHVYVPLVVLSKISEMIFFTQTFSFIYYAII